MPTPIVQFENVRKHYQMGLVTVEALRGVSFGNAAISLLPRGFDGTSDCYAATRLHERCSPSK